MKRILQLSLFILSLTFSSGCSVFPKKPFEQNDQSSTSEIRIMSWNMKRLGRDSLDYRSAVEVLKSGDVIAIQEVNINNGKVALEKLSLMLEKEIRQKTCEGITEPTTGPGSERYAFIWINAKVSFVRASGEVVTKCPDDAIDVSLNRTHHDKIDREPGQAKFKVRSGGAVFTLANVHLVPTAKKPANEVPWLFDSVKNESGIVVVVGDFNLGSSHKAYETARTAGFIPALDNQKTSLKSSERNLNQPYDNIWVRGVSVKSAEVINLFEKFSSLDQKSIYNGISDHSAVVALIGL